MDGEFDPEVRSVLETLGRLTAGGPGLGIGSDEIADALGEHFGNGPPSSEHARLREILDELQQEGLVNSMPKDRYSLTHLGRARVEQAGREEAE
jgi:ribosomal protein S19E (S16A)